MNVVYKHRCKNEVKKKSMVFKQNSNNNNNNKMNCADDTFLWLRAKPKKTGHIIYLIL